MSRGAVAARTWLARCGGAVSCERTPPAVQRCKTRRNGRRLFELDRARRYVGASSLKELPKRTTFIRVTQQLNTVFGTVDLSKKK